jgi:hypothetical protein
MELYTRSLLFKQVDKSSELPFSHELVCGRFQRSKDYFLLAFAQGLSEIGAQVSLDPTIWDYLVAEIQHSRGISTYLP